MHYLSLLFFVPALLILGVGCGPDCQSTCSKIYQSECGIERPGASQPKLVQECMGYCEDALSKPGKMEIMIPNKNYHHLKNPNWKMINKQLCGWNVEQTAGNLEKHYCAPIW